MSVIIPVYNDREGLKKTVCHLMDQSSDDYEVITVDNGSTDGTDKLARSFAERGMVKYAEETSIQSSYAARNTGVEAAEGEILGFLDADTWVKRDYVEKALRKMQKPGRDYMGCNVEIVGDKSWMAKYNRASGFPIEKYLEESRFAPTNCLVTKRQVYEDIGGFEEGLVSSGDVVFGRKAYDLGYNLVYEPDITIYHPSREKLREHISKSIRIGRGRQQGRQLDIEHLNSRSILHPRNYAPTDPLYFYQKVSGEYDWKGQLIMWYLVSCFLGWCTTYGRLREYLDQKYE